MNINRPILCIASILGATAVICGAMGAHLLRDQLIHGGAPLWHTATFYLFVHALGLLFLSLLSGVKKYQKLAMGVAISWVLGSVCFSGSLYGLALNAPRFFAQIAPIGGVLFIVGWLTLGVASFLKK